MKVLFINTLYAPHIGGGAELTLKILVEGLAARGVEVVVLATSDQPGLHQDEVDGIRVWRAGLRNIYWHYRQDQAPYIKRRIWHAMDSYNPLMASHVRRVVELEKPDVASCHNLPGWSVSAWSALRAKGLPTVQVLHDHYLACPGCTMFKNNGNCQTQCASCHLMRLPHPKLSRKLTGVVGVSRYILDRHLDMGYFQGVPIQRVIHNARSPESLGLAMQSRDKLNSRDIYRFGFIGTLAPSKGIELLLQSFILQALPNTELWIAGTGHTAYQRSLQRQYGKPNVRFLGRVEPSAFFPKIDAAVIPSLWNEPLGRVVFEAMAYGLPVIGSRRGGIPEMVENDNNGLLLEPDHPEELARAMRRLAESRELSAKMGKAARAASAPFIDMDRFLGEYMRVYETGCGRAVERLSSSHTPET